MSMMTMLHLDNSSEVVLKVDRLPNSHTNCLDLEGDGGRVSVFISNDQLAELRDVLDNYLLAHEERCAGETPNPCADCDKECLYCDHMINAKKEVV